MESELKIVRKTSATATLKLMKSGMTAVIPTRVVKTNSLRTAGERLKKQGYVFHITEQGMVNETLVTCVKSPTKQQ